MNPDKGFLGTGWSFPPQFEGTACAVRMVSAEQDVRESLHILLSTHPGERVMQPAYGCGLKRRVFDSIDESTLSEVRDEIEQAVLFFEVRITLHEVEVDLADSLEGILRIVLDYTIRSTNTRHNVVFPFYHLQGSALRMGSDG